MITVKLKNRNAVLIILPIIICALAGATYYLFVRESDQDQTPHTMSPLLGNVTVYFIDVGQGDCIFIDTLNRDMLIDGGTENAGNIVVKFLQDLGITHIDFVVASHPHADHIGGLIKVLEEYNSTYAPVIIDCGFTTSSKVYQDFIALANERTLKHAVRGQVIILDTYVNLTVLNPKSPLEFDNPNDNSVVLRMQVYNVTFLFTGDSESKSETSILKAGLNVTSTIFKVGHHGSRTATSLEFLEAVNPRVAIISVGLGNSYGHPHQETIEKLTSLGIIIYRTDLDGTITVTTDGIHYTIITENP